VEVGSIEWNQARAGPAATSVRASLRSSIRLPWGPDGAFELALPASGMLSTADLEVVWPDLQGSVKDYTSALARALEAPLGSPPLEKLVTPGQTVAIVVDDPSRWTPVNQALPVLLGRLHAVGIRPEDVTICVGVGRHHAVDAAAMEGRVGSSIATHYRCFSPPVDDLSAYVDLGTTSRGVPVRIFRPVAEAGIRVLIGSVLPHLQAGFGGGYKLIFPGTSHRTTLGALHRQGLEGHSDASALLGGQAAGNPMRQAIGEAAERLGPCWSLSHLLGGKGEIFRVAAGDPEQVQDLLASEAQERFVAPRSAPADLIVVGNHPWPGDPMQSFKTLLHHRAASRPGGVLVGLFWTDPAEIGRSFPVGALRRIAATGKAGGWAIRGLVPLAQQVATAVGSPAAFMIRWARELVVDRTVLVYAPPLHDLVGPRLGPVQLFADQAELWSAATRALECRPGDTADTLDRPVRVRVFPQGGLTYVPR
jgi:hypothetical protein